MKKIFIIGIGAGDPDYVTIQAVNAMNEVDVFFIMDKGSEKEKLTDLRREICRRYVKGENYRFVEADSPSWNRKSDDYRKTIGNLNRDKEAVFDHLISDELADGETGAFLVWGDPSLYDSTVRIIEAIAGTGRHELEFEVIPGISSIQALAAKHRTTLNRIGKSVEITTGRRAAESFPGSADSVVVMLDAEGAYQNFADQDIDIFWGAYIGTPDEVLVSGKLSEVAEEIHRVRTKARETHGWIMDTYLMRESDDGEK